MGVYNALELARENQVKGMLFVSSVQVYGGIKESGIKEDAFGPLDCMKEASIYSESKRMGEMLCYAYYKEYELPVKSVRLFHVYGENEEYKNGTF